MPAPVPLPLTWRILTTVHCPSCNEDMHFFSGQNGSFVRDMYCANSKCPQRDHIYTIEMALDGVQVIKVVQ